MLPIYAIVALGATPLQYGLIDGLYQGAAALVRVASGVVSDRWSRYKEVAVVGYGLSAVCRVLLLTVGGTIGGLSASIVADRIGKGIRTAPRDALITLSSSKERLGTAFGVHRAMDTVGAMLGPLVAVGILLLAPGDFNAVFAVSLCFAVLGLAVLILLVQNKRRQSVVEGIERRPGIKSALALLGHTRYRTLVIVGSALGLVTISDAFIYLGIQRSMDLDNALFPLLFVGSALTFMVLAVPVGRLADRIGRTRVFVGGYALLPIVYTALIVPNIGAGPGRSRPAAPRRLLRRYRRRSVRGCRWDGAEKEVGSALGLLVTFQSLAKLAASVLFGLLWTALGIHTAAVIFLVALLIVLAAAAVTVGRPAWGHSDA